MKRRESMLALAVGILVLLALLSAFAIELSNTQANSKRDVIGRVHERGVLAAALIDSLFNTVTQQRPLDQARFGGRTVSTAQLNRARQGSLYVALADPSGHVIAQSPGFTAQARAALATSAALRLVQSGRPFGLGDVQPYGRTGQISLIAAFPTRYGPRLLINGFAPAVLSSFLEGDLRRIPGVKGAQNYLIDARGAILASTDPRRPAGRLFNGGGQAQTLHQASGDRGGQYHAELPIANATWRLLLTAPDGPLFASVTGLRKWLPWVIFAAFALVAIIALALGRRALAAAAGVHDANERLADLNGQLEDANAALERRAAELARSNAELEQFASIASHDLQEPLRKVRTFTQQVIDRETDGLSDRGRDYLGRASDAAERMQRLIEDLLRFSRVSTQGRPFAPVDLQSLMDEVELDLEAAVHESGATLRVGPLPTINGDAAQLRQMLQNLVSNALKFRRPDVPLEVAVDAAVGGHRVTLSVTDNGIGFDPRYERRIFRVFERLHSRSEYPGTGIGLALCRKIAERHGGTIGARSVPGEGARFEVILPLHQREEVLPVSTGSAGSEAELTSAEGPYVPV
jgi:signal transduction histidine kinase